MAQNPQIHSYFDGTDPRFPDLGATPWFATLMQRAAVQAREFRFQFLGPEHLIYELLAESGFRSLLGSAGGDVDLCKQSLERGFREHCQFSSRSEKFLLTDRMAKLLSGFEAFVNGPEGENGEAVLAYVFIEAIKACEGSMLAEAVIQDCGAASLLLSHEDVTYMDDVMGYDRALDAQFDSMPVYGSEAFDPEPYHPKAFVPMPGDNAPLDRLLDRMGPDAKRARKSDGRDEQKPKERTPAQPQAPAPKRDAAVEAVVDACLRNLGEMAAMGDIDPVMGRDAEVDVIMSALRRRRKSSIILSGEAGVGKTAIAEAVALRLRSGLVEPRLARRPFYELAMQDLVAGTKYRGDFEARMQTLIGRLRAEKAIVFIDEFHMIVGSGSTYGSGMDGANMLKTALGRGEITVIGATTPAEMRELRRDAALMRRFDTMQISEPTRAETLEILKGSAWSYLSHHQLDSDKGVFEEICRITDLYQPDRRFPDKAFDLMDAACVVCVEENQEVDGFLPMLGIEHVREASDRMGLRRPRVPAADVLRRLNALEQGMKDRLGDQEAAIATLSNEANAAMLNLRPGGVRSNILIPAPANAAPEAFARAFAAQMSLPFIRIDMSQIRDMSQIFQLIGLPNPIGPDRTGRLVEAGDGHREMVLWLWGIEQAGSAVQEFIAETCRTGSFRAADGRTVSLRGAWVMTGLTSDPAQESGRIGFSRSDERDDDEGLSKYLPAEMIASYDAVIRLAKPTVRAGGHRARSAIKDLELAMKELGARLLVDQAAAAHLGRHDSDAEIRREIRDQIRNPAMKRVLSGQMDIPVTVVGGVYRI